MNCRNGLAGLLAVALVAGSLHAEARTLEVGSGLAFASPSEAAAVAEAGDVVSIAPGSYFDCAVWRADRLTIAATAPGVVITDKACGGKAAFVVVGDAVSIRGVTFARIRVADGNGAGIRAEGRDLTVQDSRFINDQAGIISAAADGFLRVDGCLFDDIGGNETDRPRAVLVGGIDRLRITHSVFQRPLGGGFVGSSADLTELQNNELHGGAAGGPLLRFGRGVAMLEGNVFDLGPAPAGPPRVEAQVTDRPGAILIDGDAERVMVRSNALIEPQGHVPLLRNWSGAAVTAVDNVVPDGVVAVSEEGGLTHRLRYRLAQVRLAAGAAARFARHQVAEVARGLRLAR